MNIVLPKRQKGTKRRIGLYIILLLACVIAVGIAIYQFFEEEKLDVILGITKSEDEQIIELKSEFNNLFTNQLKTNQNIQIEKINRINNNNDLLYTEYKNEEKSINNYDLNVNIPCININSSIAKKYNEEIKKIFKKTSEDILQTTNRNIVYTVNYCGSIQNNILSIAIYATFKEENSVQRTIIKTYNYNLNTNIEVKLDDFMNIKNVDKKTLQAKIKSVINEEQEQAEQLKNLGYDIFTRDVTDNMYKVENTTNYFMYDDYLYIIYSYGNKNNTSEMDIVIL